MSGEDNQCELKNSENDSDLHQGHNGDEGGEDIISSAGKGDDNLNGNNNHVGSQKLTKEQLLEYVKKQKIKIKQLENKISELEGHDVNKSDQVLQKLKLALKMKIQDLESYKELTSAKDKEIEILQEDLNLFRVNENAVTHDLMLLISERMNEEQMEMLKKDQQQLSSLHLVKILSDLLLSSQLNDSTSISSHQTNRTVDTLTWLDTNDDTLDIRIKDEIKNKMKMKFLEMKEKHQRVLEEKEREHQQQISELQTTSELKIRELSSQLEKLRDEINEKTEESLQTSRSYQDRIQDLEQIVTTQSDQITNFQTMITEQNLEIDKLKTEISKLTDENTEFQAKSTEYNSKLEIFQNVEMELRNEKQIMSNEIDKLQLLLQQREQELSDSHEKLNELIQEKSLRENLEKELNELLRQNKLNYETERGEMKRSFEEELEMTKKLNLDEITCKQTEIDLLKSTIRSLEDLQSNEKERNQLYREEMNQLLSIRDQKILDLGQNSTSLHSTLEDLESQLKLVMQERDQLIHDQNTRDELDDNAEEGDNNPNFSMIPMTPTTPTSSSTSTSASMTSTTPSTNHSTPTTTPSSKRAAKKKAKKAKLQSTAGVAVLASQQNEEPSLSDQITSLQMENNEIKTQFNSIKSLNDEYKSLISQFETRELNQKIELSHVQDQLLTTQRAHENEQMSYENRIKELENQLTIEMNNEQSVVERELSKWEEINLKYQAALSEWDDIREQYERKEINYMEEIQALRDQLNVFTLRRQEEITLQDLKFEEQKLLLEKILQENSSLTSLLNAKDQQTSDFEQSIESQEMEMKSLLEQISEMKVRKVQLQDNMTDIMNKYESETAGRGELQCRYEMEIQELHQRLNLIGDMKSSNQETTTTTRTTRVSPLLGEKDTNRIFETVPEDTTQTEINKEIEKRFDQEFNEENSTELKDSTRNLEKENELFQMRMSLESQVNTLTDELTELRQHVSRLEGERDELIGLRSEITTLQEKIQTLEEEKQDLLNQQERNKREEEERVEILQRELENQISMIRAELEGSIATLTEEKAVQAKENDEKFLQQEQVFVAERAYLTERIRIWEEKVLTLENQLLEGKFEIDTLREQLKSQGESKKGVEQKLKKFAVELKTKHTSLTQLQSEIEKLNERNLRKDEEIERITKKFEVDYQQLEEQTKSQLRAMETEMKKTEKIELQKIQNLIHENSRLKEEMNTLQLQLSNEMKIREEYEIQEKTEKEWRSNAEIKIKKYAQELKSRGSAVKELTEELNRSKDLATSQQQSIHNLEEELRNLQHETTQKIQQLNEESQEQINSLQTEIQHLQDRLEGTKNEVNGEKEVFLQQFYELEEWKKTNEIKLKKYALELKSRQEIIRDLKMKQDDWLRQKTMLEGQITRLEKTNQDLISNDDLETEMQRLKEENCRLQEIIQEKNSSIVHSPISGTISSPGPAPGSASTAATAATSTASLIAELNEEKDKRKASEVKVKKYALELRAKLTSIKELKEELENLKLENNKFQHIIETHEEELRNLHRQYEEISKIREEEHQNDMQRLKGIVQLQEDQHRQDGEDREVLYQQQINEITQNYEMMKINEKEQFQLQLSEVTNLNLKFQTEIESLQIQNSNSASRIQTLTDELESINEQNSRLKTLLLKSQDLSQEREMEINKLLQDAITPWESCELEYFVEGGLSSTEKTSNSSIKWYLLSTHLIQDKDPRYLPHIHQYPTQHKSYQWIDEMTLLQWMTNHSTVITPSSSYLSMISSLPHPLSGPGLGTGPGSGSDPLPTPTPTPSSDHTTWLSLEKISSTIQEKIQKQMDLIQTENTRLRSELELLTQQFQTYKLRAQTALKRIGKDEQIERFKHLEEEDNASNEMKTKILDLERILETSETEKERLLTQLNEMKERGKEQNKQMNEYEERERLHEMRVNDLKLEMKRVEEKNNLLEEMIGRLQTERNELSDRLHETSRGRGGKTKAVEEREEKDREREREESESNHEIEKSHEMIEPTRHHKSSQPTTVSLFSPSSVEGNVDHQVYLAHIQAATTLQEVVNQLKQELSETTMEKSELQHIVSLNEDQISVLKITIRDLESTLGRERELNSSNRTLNTEYLVNVLKSFLLTKNPSEQSKLVPVLCSILHFQADDTKEICEIWSKKVSNSTSSSGGSGGGSGGLMGWFLPSSSSSSSSSSSASSHQIPNREQYTDGIGGLDIY